jgi:hypothetical protein
MTSSTRDELEGLMAQRIVALGNGRPAQLLTVYRDDDGTFRISEDSVIPEHECTHTLARHLALLPGAIMGGAVPQLVARTGFWGLMLIAPVTLQVLENGVPGTDDKARMGVTVSRMDGENTIMAILCGDSIPLGEPGGPPCAVAGPPPDRMMYQIMGAMMAGCC